MYVEELYFDFFLDLPKRHDIDIFWHASFLTKIQQLENK